ncbi:hypothetical protein DWX40_16085 [Bacteroides stercoris]|nr:hypothetical protein DWX40_16085 [Bacteroides stercoris]
MSLRKTLYLYVKKKKGIMDFEGECNTRTASVFQLKRKGEKVTSMLNPTPDFLRGLVWKPKKKSE